jgi:hypothetical protein
MRFFLVSLLFILSIQVEAQPYEVTVIKDLEADWKIFSEGQYRDQVPSKNTRAIYFLIDTDLYKGASLRIESQKEFSTFIDGKLITSNKKGIIFYDLDSLSALYSTPLVFSIIKPTVKISTQLVIKNIVTSESKDLMQRKSQYFLDFSVIASLILLVFFVGLLRTNPKLTFDYLNFIKLFSAKEREENIMTIRITSSVNLLFFLFAGLLTAFLLMIIFYFAYTEISIAHFFQVRSLQQGFFQWFKLTGIILLILFSKLILISMFSFIHKASEIAALQFFNFVRLFFFTFGVVSLLVAVFFMAKVQNPMWYYNLFYVAAGIFLFWEFIMFLKLMTRLPFRIFHLFFYLCASELIPFVILLKVVFY